MIATIGKQKVTIDKLEKVERLIVRLDDRMVDLDSEVLVERDGKVLIKAAVIRMAGTLLRTLAERGDPQSMFDGEFQLNFK